jgi:hypothetical protein
MMVLYPFSCVARCRVWPGGQLAFSLRQKRQPKKGDRKTLPFGFPQKQLINREMKSTRFAQTYFISYPLYHLFLRLRLKRFF